MKHFLPLLVAVLLMGCSTTARMPKKFARVQPGMTQQEVINLLGKPHWVSNEGSYTVYDYRFKEGDPLAMRPEETPTTQYYVIIGPDGRVRSCGVN